MKIFKLILISFLLIVGTAHAQKGVMKVEPSLSLVFPNGEGLNTGFGINGTFFYGINKNIDLTGTLGYISFGTEYDGLSFSSIPLLFGGRYSFDVEGTITPYAAAELGFQFISSSVEINYGFGSETVSASETEFGIGIGGGAYFQVNENIVIDGNLQFNTMGDGGE
ncbi:MAG: outer membrane beta-barrel protein, partial [Bacteroidota bacterium]